MSAPSAANRNAMARPMPWSPPVMMATLPSRRFRPTLLIAVCVTIYALRLFSAHKADVELNSFSCFATEARACLTTCLAPLFLHATSSSLAARTTRLRELVRGWFRSCTLGAHSQCAFCREGRGARLHSLAYFACAAASSIIAATSFGRDTYTQWLAPATSTI